MKIYFPLYPIISLIFFIVGFSSCQEDAMISNEQSYNILNAEENLAMANSLSPNVSNPSENLYQQYMDAFEEVYKTMQENYYAPVERSDFDRFIEQFNTKIYANLKKEGKSGDYVRWRSAALLVDFLKTDEDIFSAFYPPEPAKEYAQTVLGVRHDLGIEGRLTEQGFQTTQVEPRSDAYTQGLRIGDVITAIDVKNVMSMPEPEINEMLTPLIDTKVKIEYVNAATPVARHIEVLSKEYFKQTVFDVPTKYPKVYCLKIARFNRKTAEDLYRFLDYYKKSGPVAGLIIDLRGNPGGPPLAAREISSFFLKGGDNFAYFQKKGQPEAMLDVPVIPDELKYDGPMVILIDKDSGSASELFAGVLQRQGRTILMGKNSAGQVMLKSMFNLSDTSMLLLITSRGHFPDGGVFSFDGLSPDRVLDDSEGVDIVDSAAKYLVYVNIHPEVLQKLRENAP